MTAKAHRLSIDIGVTYLLFKLHEFWWKTELALIFQVSTYSMPLFTHSALVELGGEGSMGYA